MNDAITQALEHFAQIRGTKRGFLMLPEGSFFLYDSKICSISSYQFRLQGEPYSLCSGQVDKPIFFGLTGGKLLCAAIPESPLAVQSLRLIFHIECGTEPDELLRGICFSPGSDAYLALFSDASIEKLFLAAEMERICHTPQIAPSSELVELQQNLCQNDLRLLTALYINGQSCKISEVQKSYQ